MREKGLTQAALAGELGVSPQAVTNWLKGEDFPRPPKLLALATRLQITFDNLVEKVVKDQPIIAFRKKAGSKTTTQHINKAIEVGCLLKPLVSYLGEVSNIRPLISCPSIKHSEIQHIIAETRNRLGIGPKAILRYEQLISEFRSAGSVLIPVMWGDSRDHKNALHILLPKENVTFIFLNLDTRIEDFKFWMAHELAHVYTPSLSGTNEGEDFADAFAGALLFPQECAKEVYFQLAGKKSAIELKTLNEYALKYAISIFTVFKQVNNYATANGLPKLLTPNGALHKFRNHGDPEIVSDELFSPCSPGPNEYLACAKNIFHSEFFYALERMVKEKGMGASYIQQVLGIGLRDAVSLHKELVN